MLKGIQSICALPAESLSVSSGGRAVENRPWLNMITGIDHPSAGTVRVADTLLHPCPKAAWQCGAGATLGIVFQFFQLLPMLTLLENVMLPMDFCQHVRPRRA